jgi:hypothetical protein
MIVCFTADLQNALRYFAPTENENFYASTPPGDIRQCCLFEVKTEEVFLSVFGQDDCWIQQRVKTSLSPMGIKMLITRDSLEKLKKFPTDTQLELRESSDGVLATSFREFNAKGHPIKLDQVILQPYPGTLDAFPTPQFANNLLAEIPAKKFYELIATVLECGEHKKDKTRPIRLSVNPFRVETNSATCSKFRFELSTLSIGEIKDTWMLRGSHLPLILGVTSKASESNVEIHYSPGVPSESPESLTFHGDLGSASLPIQKGVDFESFKRGLDYISIFPKAELVAERQIQRDRLEDALKIQHPGAATTPTVILSQENTNLRLSKQGDVTKKEVSNLPFVITEGVDNWPECRIDYNALVLLTSLTRRLKSIHEAETDLIKLRLASHCVNSARQRARRSRQKDYLINVVLSEKESGYQIVIPVQVNEIPQALESKPVDVATTAA